MNPVQKKARIREIDIARGFALFLTVFGHVVLRDSLWFNWIFTFHMPAFFFLSGMTFHPETSENFGGFVKNRFRKRLIPYFAAIAAGVAICLLRPDYRAVLLQFDWKYIVSWAFYYAQPKELYVGQVWFLAALFMAELMAYGWFKVFAKRSILLKGYSLLLIAFLGIAVSRINPYLPFGERLPWKIDTALTAFVFLILGYYASEWKLTERLKSCAWLTGPVCTYLNYYFGVRMFGYTNMCDCIYFPAPYYYAAALTGIIALLSGAVICRNSRFWQYCGRNSLVMFISQTFAIYWVLEIIAVVTGVMYTPRYDIPGNRFALAVSVAAFVLMIAFAALWNRCRRLAVARADRKKNDSRYCRKDKKKV